MGPIELGQGLWLPPAIGLHSRPAATQGVATGQAMDVLVGGVRVLRRVVNHGQLPGNLVGIWPLRHRRMGEQRFEAGGKHQALSIVPIIEAGIASGIAAQPQALLAAIPDRTYPVAVHMLGAALAPVAPGAGQQLGIAQRSQFGDR